MPFTFKRLSIPDVILVEPSSFSDDRGFFFESFKESDFFSNGLDKNFVQDNFSHSVNGVIRGLHFQKAPKAQAKLVTVLKGKIFDVVIDLRPESKTFMSWASFELDSNESKILYIPEGFAHGFQTLEDNTELVYQISNWYSPEHASGLRWDDNKFQINWPIQNPIISKKDLTFDSAEKYLKEHSKNSS